ncbi:acyl-CoA carboxylase subunit epsilon [Salinactinospora qingdaonensis]|uniref:Acyl-CoA carboxylase epsilon subunit n=1 Tax=Salinactinospora qingdaonensis TaxID=702744 RepID=A0ABP7G029_9ACTN
MSTAEPDAAPLLQIVRGDATAEEIAALTAALTVRAQAAGDQAGTDATRTPRSAWKDRSALLRGHPRPGPGAWRRSFHPS